MKPSKARPSRRATAPASKVRAPRWAILATSLLALGVAVAVGFSLTHQTRRVAHTAPVATPAPAIRNPDQLGGRWLRTDGDYVIEIRRVKADGKLDAAYFNPRPIHVARAESTQEGDRLKLFLVLEDTGYPGCHYTLVYDPKQDRLKGLYFQAALGQEFDVEFVRMDPRL